MSVDDTSYFETEEFQKLLARYEKMVNEQISDYFSSDELNDIISYYMNESLFDDALSVIGYGRSLYPSNDLMLIFEARIFLQKGDISKAEQLMNKVAQKDEPELLLLEAEICFANGDYELGYNKLVNILETVDEKDDIVFDIYDHMLEFGFPYEALTFIENNLKRNPDDIPLLEIKAECLIEQFYFREAIDIYNFLLDKDPYSKFYWEQTGRIYVLQQNYDMALESFEYVLTIDDTEQYPMLMKGYCLFFLKKYKKAIQSFDSLIEKTTDIPLAFFYKAIALSVLDKKYEALEIYDHIATTFNDIDFRTALDINKSILLLEMKFESESTQLFNSALEHSLENNTPLHIGTSGYIEPHDYDNANLFDIFELQNQQCISEETLLYLAISMHRGARYEHSKQLCEFMKTKGFTDPDIDAHLAYYAWQSQDSNQFNTFLKSALDGKSSCIYHLFGLPNHQNLTLEEFKQSIKK